MAKFVDKGHGEAIPKTHSVKITKYEFVTHTFLALLICNSRDCKIPDKAIAKEHSI